MTYQMANLIAGKRRTSALIWQPIFDKTVDGRIFSDFLTVFRFPAGRDSRVIKQNLKARILVALTVSALSFSAFWEGQPLITCSLESCEL